MEDDAVDDSGSVIVCSHIAKENYPILLAIRDEPTDAIDSGWQFLCNAMENEDTVGVQVWSVKDILNHEPTLAEFIKQQPGAILIRDNKNTAWKIVHRD
jgi:hypothetical protein